MTVELDRIASFITRLLGMNLWVIDPRGNVSLRQLVLWPPEPLFDNLPQPPAGLALEDPAVAQAVLVHVSPLDLRYLSAPMPSAELLVVGPYLQNPPPQQWVDRMLRRHGLPLSLRHALRQYYLSLPVMSLGRERLVMDLLALLVSAQEVDRPALEYSPRMTTLLPRRNLGAQLLSQEEAAERVEANYRLEEKMLRAVAEGDLEGLKRIITEQRSVDVLPLLSRAPGDPLRAMKNACLVLNTLLRRAAASGGVHPVYLDSISGRYSVLIERCTTLAQLGDLTEEMQLEYCRLVLQMSIKGYSDLVRRAIEYLRVHFVRDVRLEEVARALGVSPFTLSRRFKRETGRSLVDYIHYVRIQHARELLRDPTLSITEVALSVGYNDPNYFSRVFRKLVGTPPSEYRKGLIPK